MRTTCRVFGIALLLLTAGFSTVYGQSGAQTDDKEYYEKIGSINAWTTDPVYRRRLGTLPGFLTVRFGQHSGFDRVVFELTDDPAGYFITYNKPPFQAEAGEDIVKVRGKAFVEIALYPVVSPDENIEANEKKVAEQNKVKMAMIREVQPVEWFEGELRYVVGLNKRTPFRVQVFSNPTRLVVDFKH